jgi:FkbM family methyltransferase
MRKINLCKGKIKMKQIIKAILKIILKPILRRYHLILDKLNKIDYIINKLSIIDGIVEREGVKFFVPNAPRDLIQNIQLSNSSFYELDILQSLDKILNENSIVIDIGANVGNHTVYWGKITNVKKIYFFEPIKSTFNILSKNIEINYLSEKVKLYNIGLSDIVTKGKIEKYSTDNIGATMISKADEGDIELNKLDNIKEIIEEPRIDFVKIDVEGAEKDVLSGAIQFFNKYKPIVFIESFEGKNQYDFSYGFFKKLNYNEPIEYLKKDNYLFIYEDIKQRSKKNGV